MSPKEYFNQFELEHRFDACKQILYDIREVPWGEENEDITEFEKIIQEVLEENSPASMSLLGFFIGVPPDDVTSMITGFYCAEAENPQMTFQTKYEEDLFRDRYARAGYERTWHDVFSRVANYVTKNEDKRKLYRDMLTSGIFLPSSPQLWNYGVGGETSGSSCFTYDIDDTLESIWKADETARDVYKASGGVGFNLSKLRPRGAKIGNSPNPAVGVLSVAERLNLTTRYITAGGRARGALMLQLDCDHPDVIEFILAKRPIRRNPGQEPAEWDLPLTQCNMSVRCSDGFMRSVEADESWPLYWANENSTTDNPFQEFAVATWEQYKEIWKQTLNERSDPQSGFFYHRVLVPAIENYSGAILARDIWELITENAWNHADPGAVFSDEYERRNTTPSLGKLHSNPCSEFLGPASGDACDLGSLNLPAIYQLDPSDFFRRLRVETANAVEYLNDSLAVNKIPVEEIHKGHNKSRRIGLGIMGLHDLLILKGLKYSSAEGREFAALVMATVESEAWLTSFELADRGYPKPESLDQKALLSRIEDYESRTIGYMDSQNDLYKQWKECRETFGAICNMLECGKLPANSTVTSIAPTGTIAQIAGFLMKHQGISSGIEPIFMWFFFREDNNGRVKISHWLYEMAKEKGLLDETADKISAQAHIEMLSDVVQFCTMSASKTVNLPETANVEEVAKAYYLAWQLQIPGTTVYRNNSKPFQVLSEKPKGSPDVVADSGALFEHKTAHPSMMSTESRPDRLQGFTEKVPVVLGNGLQKNIYITINHTEEHPYEVFFYGLNRDEMQDPIARELGTVGRLVSMAMRYHVPVEEIIDQLEKIDGQHLFSLPTKLSKLLSAFVSKDEEGNARLHCKQCGKVTPHQMTDGCKVCMKCGLSAC